MTSDTAPRPPTPWPPHSEPFTSALRRTTLIALAVALVASLARQQFLVAPRVWLLAMWFSLGGHYVELFFLNRVRPRLPFARAAQVGGRVVTWFLGGALLSLGMAVTWALLTGGQLRFHLWWLGGLGLIGVELMVHAVLRARDIPNFYDGRL